MSGILLTLNPGSSTIKLGLYSFEGDEPTRIGGGQVDLRETPLRLTIKEGGRAAEIALKAPVTDDLHEVIAETLTWLAQHFDHDEITAVGHRVVHGGDLFTGPAVIDDKVEAEIASLVPLAPLHQPKSLKLIRAVKRLWPEVPQTASFDTAFHQRQAEMVRRFALPRELYDQGVKRYGFHGLSYDYIAGALPEMAPDIAKGRVAVAHLGSGASLCALDDGVSRDSSMGFSTLEGVPMATRCGALDPGVILHFQQQMGLSIDEVDDMLYHRSGLLGLSGGLSADARDLVESGRPEASQAIEIFAFQIARQAAMLAVSLGGLDAFVFTAGIGEHLPEIRSAVVRHLALFGAALNEEANRQNALRLDAPQSKLALLVIPTNEERVIAREALRLLRR